MLRRMIIPLIFGLGGCAVLISLGSWQVQRLSWKQAKLADIDARIAAAPVVLPRQADPEQDLYLPVELGGDFTGEELHVLASVKRRGPGYRVIAVMNTTDGRRVMVDRGFIAINQKDAPRAAASVKVQGNLHWPNETDGFTPDNDQTRNIWFARDVPKMAAALQAEPLLVVARASSATTPPVTPLPVSSSIIPNDHLQYAITWFSLAFLWFGMTAYLLWRIRQRTA